MDLFNFRGSTVLIIVLQTPRSHFHSRLIFSLIIMIRRVTSRHANSLISLLKKKKEKSNWNSTRKIYRIFGDDWSFKNKLVICFPRFPRHLSTFFASFFISQTFLFAPRSFSALSPRIQGKKFGEILRCCRFYTLYLNNTSNNGIKNLYQ